MLEAVVKALTQMFSPPFRSVLLKSIGLALVVVVLLGFGLYHAFAWLADAGASWGQSNVGAVPPTVWSVLSWVFAIAAGLGIVTGAVFLMPAVTAFVGSFFVDEIAEQVERKHYPADIPGVPLPFVRSLWEGVMTALLTILVYVLAFPFVLFLGLGFVLLFLANAWLLSREYFELSAMRFRSPAEAKALRRAHRGQVFFAGLFIAALVSIPIVNLITPLFATALMVHVHKRVTGRRAEIIDPKVRRLPR